ncbi:hypothetical protein OQA88_12681 [Cercophora sp. LCS_1]
MTSFFLALLALTSAATASHHRHHDVHHHAQRALPLPVQIGLAIDTTGSMGGYISNMRPALKQLLNDRLGSSNQPAKLVLSPFHDPEAGPLTDTDDRITFGAMLDTLTAEGGLDCPELAIRGIRLALESLPTGGELYVVTDASAKDAAEAEEAIEFARARGVKIFFFLFGSLCGVGEPAYLRIAAATGGQAHSGLTLADAARVTKLIDAVSRINHSPIAHITPDIANPIVSLSAIPPAAADRRSILLRAFISTVQFAVDATLSSLVLSIDGGTSFTLTGPNGPVPAALQTTVELTRGVVVNVATPVAGDWSVTVNDCDSCSVSIFGDASIRAESFLLLRNVTGAAPITITDPPVIGCEYLTSVRVEGNISSPVFELRTAAGVFISTISPGPVAATPGVFYGAVEIPNVPFLVYVRGVDGAGSDILRVVPGLLTPVVGTCPGGALVSSTAGGSVSVSASAGGSVSGSATGVLGGTTVGSVTGSTIATGISGSASASGSAGAGVPGTAGGSASTTGSGGGVSASGTGTGTGAGSVAATVVSQGVSATDSVVATGSLAAPAPAITTHTQTVVGGPCGLTCNQPQEVEAVTHVVINWTSVCASLTTIVKGTYTTVSTAQETYTRVLTIASHIPCATCTGPNYPPPCHGPSCGAIPAIPLVPACHGPECAAPPAPAAPTPCHGPGCPIPLVPPITIPIVPGCSGPNCPAPACSGPNCPPLGTGIPGTPVVQPLSVVTAGASENGIKEVMLGQIYAVVLAMLLW